MDIDTKTDATGKPTPRAEALAEASEALATLATGAMGLLSAMYNLLEDVSKSHAANTADSVATEQTADIMPATTPPPKAEPMPSAQPDPAPTVPGSVPKPAITPDDITKVCVALIKRKRENSQRIQALLQTYGVSQMSALDPAKYEAFMADLVALGE